MGVIVSRHPYYGYGIRINRKADLTDTHLSLRAIERAPLGTLVILGQALLGFQPTTGFFRTGRKISVLCEKEQWCQTDGNLFGSGKEFLFEYLPDCIRLLAYSS